MTDHKAPLPFIVALSAYSPADLDGVMVFVSRQAIDETLAHIAALEAGRDDYKDVAERLQRLLDSERNTTNKLEAENKRLREALEKIANNKFLSYENTEASMYGTGVTDGHRLAAQWARAALAQTDGGGNG